MQQPVETGRQENPQFAGRLERVLSVGTRLRGRHYGQRSCVPHQQVEHTAAPTSKAELQKNPCQRGAVHTRRIPVTCGEDPPTSTIWTVRTSSNSKFCNGRGKKSRGRRDNALSFAIGRGRKVLSSVTTCDFGAHSKKVRHDRSRSLTVGRTPLLSKAPRDLGRGEPEAIRHSPSKFRHV